MNGPAHGIGSTLARAAFALAAIVATATPAAADWHTLTFSFANYRPNGETISAFITNQNRFTTIRNGSSSEITSPFETTGYQHSTGYYDVRVTKEGQQTNVYCSYQAVAAYKGTSGWECSVTRNTQENGATTCRGVRSQFWNHLYPCAFDFDTQ